MAHILVIDDDDLVRRTMNQILSNAGHRVTLAGDGVQGTKLFHDEPPDLVIIDILMPEREGIEVIRDLRRYDAKLGIIAMSGGWTRSPINASVERGFDLLRLAQVLGASTVLAKPFRSEELLEKVTACLSA